MPDVLSVGKTGLFAAKKSIEVTSHNLANANTEGYSRQKVDQTTNIPITESGIIMGSGARVVGKSRYHDQHLEKRMNGTLTQSKFFKERAEQLEQVEGIFNEIDSEGLNQIINKFYNSFRDLANAPENDTIRSVVRDNASLVVKDFHRIRETVDNVTRSIDSKIKATIEDVNSITRNISDLNKRIATLEAAGDEASDLRDQRDLFVSRISEVFQVSTYTDDKNNFVVSADGLGSLVVGSSIQELAAGSVNKSDSGNNMDGSIEVFFKNRPGAHISDNLKGGILTSMIKVRNDDLRGMRDKMDNLAHEFTQTVNAIHRRGFVNRKIELDEAGNHKAFDQKGPVTGINFFEELPGIENAALNITLSKEVRDDLSNVATALEPNKSGDNRVAIAISKLQHEKILENGTSTIEENFLKLVGRIGLEAGKARLDHEQSESIFTQTKSIKERLSGVSIDEETANLVRYQHAYEASAKVMKTADEMFKTVLALKQ